jgi:TRAP-type C4-dicarboxylate transport system substrate-binding protein
MRAPETKVWEIPYLFESFEHIEKYIASPNGQKVIEKINTNNPDYQIVGYSYSGGPLYIFSHTKINSLSDLKKQKLSLSVEGGFNKDFLSVFKVKGIREGTDEKKEMNSEILAAGAESVCFREDNDQLWVNVSNHRMVSRFVGVSKAALNRIPAAHRDFFVTELTKLMTKERQYSMDGAKLSMDILKNRGIHLNVWDREHKVADLKKLEAPLNVYRNLLENEIAAIDALNPNQPYFMKLLTTNH